MSVRHYWAWTGRNRSFRAATEQAAAAPSRKQTELENHRPATVHHLGVSGLGARENDHDTSNTLMNRTSFVLWGSLPMTRMKYSTSSMFPLSQAYINGVMPACVQCHGVGITRSAHAARYRVDTSPCSPPLDPRRSALSSKLLCLCFLARRRT